MKELEIIYEDKDVLVIRKPAGVPVQSARVGAKDCESLLKNYLYRKNPKGGAPYLGLIHRLDQPVEGLVVFALNPKAAAALSKQSAGKEMQKTYLAVRHSVDKCPHPVPNEEKLWIMWKTWWKTGMSAWITCGRTGKITALRWYRRDMPGLKKQCSATGF